jgi:hypothetical protein
MQILVLIGSSVSQVGQVKVCHFPFERYMAYNNLHSTTVHAVTIGMSFQVVTLTQAAEPSQCQRYRIGG